jgi:alkaline phosphatase D
LQIERYTTDYYTKLYRQIYASPSWTQDLRNVAWLHMFDDHEIINDYAPSGTDVDLYTEAIPPFHHYQMVANPSGIDKIQKSYFTFNTGQVSFFVLDNRSYRSAQPHRQHENSTAGWGDRTMLGDRQMRHLRSWAYREGTQNKRLLVVVSGVPFTRNWSKGGDEFDSWAVSDHVGRCLILGLSE